MGKNAMDSLSFVNNTHLFTVSTLCDSQEIIFYHLEPNDFNRIYIHIQC